MLAYGISRRGAVRPNNEDSFYCDAQAGLLVVADGIGGHAGGEIASRLAVDTAVKAVKEAGQCGEAVVNRAFAAANAAILQYVETRPALAGMGTTLTLVKKNGYTLVVGHIGDSRAYLFRQGVLKCLTSDHSVSGQLLAAGEITASEARNHPQRHILTRALGTAGQPQVEVLSHQVQTGDIVLVCTDGLSDLIAGEEIAAELSDEGKTIEQHASFLIDMAYQRGAPDNVTVVLAQLK